MNILWIQPNGVLALTSVFNEIADAQRVVAELAPQVTPDMRALAASDMAPPPEFIELSAPALPDEPQIDGSATVEEADDIVAAHRAEVDAIMAKHKEAREANRAAHVAACRSIIEQNDSIHQARAVCAAHDMAMEQAGGPELADYAALLQRRGDIPADWVLAGLNVDWPDSGWAHEAHRWDKKKKAIVVDMDAARDETNARLRRERAPLLADLDVRYMRALEAGENTAPIVAEKQRLRDITAQADACVTLDELHAMSAR